MKTYSTANPFAQSEQLQELTFFVSADELDALEDAFDDIAFSFSVDAAEDGSGKHRVQILCDGADAPLALAQISLTPETQTSVEDADWVALSQADFKPMKAGRFYIYGSHITDPIPTSMIPILMDAGAAFGTGEHATTSGCLQLLSSIPTRPLTVLDMGCGTAILGIGAAKLWPDCRVLAADNCPVAVRVSDENVKRNHTAHQTRCVVSEGFDSASVRKSGPYDLILANILALPLMQMAPKLRAATKRGGYIILSGLLTRQETRVIARYRNYGFQTVRCVRQSDWSAILMYLPPLRTAALRDEPKAYGH